MYQSLWKSACILNNISAVQCTIDYTTFAVSGKVEQLGDCCYSNWPSYVGPQ